MEQIDYGAASLADTKAKLQVLKYRSLTHPLVNLRFIRFKDGKQHLKGRMSDLINDDYLLVNVFEGQSEVPDHSVLVSIRQIAENEWKFYSNRETWQAACDRTEQKEERK
jgi:hypothetical protein